MSKNEFINFIKSYFPDGYKTKDYASLISELLKKHDIMELVENGPGIQNAIKLSEDENIHLWFAPAGNIPIGMPKLIIMGQATSIQALDNLMGELNPLNLDEKIIRKILIESSFKGIMLGNLGAMLNYLNINEALKSDLDIHNEWSNLDDAKHGTDHTGKGILFDGSRETEIMFSQWCMHCGTQYKNEKKGYNTNAVNMGKFIKLNDQQFGGQNDNLIKEKYFNNQEKQILLLLGEKLYNYIKNKYYMEFNKIDWIDSDDSGYEVNHNKIISWIPHPSQGNKFYNPTKNNIGIMDEIISSNNIDHICRDYPSLKNLAQHVIKLKEVFNDFKKNL